MPFSSGPNTVNDSIVFNFDIGDTTNSYKGEPTTNTVSTTSFNPLDLYTWASSGNTSTWARDTSINPSPVKGIALKEVSFGTDSYSGTYNSNTWNLGSAAVGQTWTVSVYALASPGTNLQIWLFGANSSGNYIELDAWSFAATGTWQRISGTRTLTNGSTVYVQARVATATNGATVWWDGLQMERKSYVTPFTPTSRSTTQALLDLSGTTNPITLTGNTIDLVNMTYGANNAISFDGTDDYTDVGSWFNYQIFTIDLWVRPGSTQTTYADIFDNNHTGTRNFVCQQNVNNTNQYDFSVINTSSYSSTGFFTLTANTWVNLTFTFDGTRTRFFRNGVLELSGNAITGPINYSSPNLRLGGWYNGGRNWNGQIRKFTTYNRVLSSTEIQNNYTELRTRFNLP